MDWSHATAFICGLMVWFLLAGLIGRCNKDLAVTRRDLMACHIYPAVAQANPGVDVGLVTSKAVYVADVLIETLDYNEPTPKRPQGE